MYGGLWWPVDAALLAHIVAFEKFCFHVICTMFPASWSLRYNKNTVFVLILASSITNILAGTFQLMDLSRKLLASANFAKITCGAWSKSTSTMWSYWQVSFGLLSRLVLICSPCKIGTHFSDQVSPSYEWCCWLWIECWPKPKARSIWTIFACHIQ